MVNAALLGVRVAAPAAVTGSVVKKQVNSVVNPVTVDGECCSVGFAGGGASCCHRFYY
jgi:hypothetical protein